MEKLVWSNQWVEPNEDYEQYREHMMELGLILKKYLNNTIGSEDYLLVVTTKVDWLSHGGYKMVDVYSKDDLELAQSIVPEHECTFELYEEDDKYFALVFSHDIPTGATWKLIPMKDVDAVMSQIEVDATLENTRYLKKRILEELGIDLDNWSKEDVTEEYDPEHYHEAVRYNGIITVLYMDENNIETIEWDLDALEEAYLDILGAKE